MRYRKRPVVVEAIQFIGPGMPGHVEHFLTSRNRPDAPEPWRFDPAGELWIYVEKSHHHCHLERGGWIIMERDGKGVYPCTATEFEATYEAVYEHDPSVA